MQHIAQSGDNKIIKLDDKDKKILNILTENSRLSFRQIAKKTSLSTATVIKHIMDLKKKEVIKGFTTKIDYEKIGYDLLAIIEVRISHGKLFSVEKKISKNSHVIGMFDMAGDYDALIIGRFSTRQSLDYFVKKIQTFDNVERTITRLVLNMIKFNDVLQF